MKRWGLFLLRVTTGWLLVMWGLDKLVNVQHGQAVAETFYFGVGTQGRSPECLRRPGDHPRGAEDGMTLDAVLGGGDQKS